MTNGNEVMQPGAASMNLSLAGAWSKAVVTRLDVARTATATLSPETYEEFGAAMSAVLVFYLAVDHAREVARRTPWIGTWPMDAATANDLHRRALRFREFFMHVEDKVDRRSPDHEAAAKKQTQTDPAPRPYGYVAASVGFEDGSAVLYAPVARTTNRLETRLSWDEMERASGAIECWATDLLSGWSEMQQFWALYVQANGSTILRP